MLKTYDLLHTLLMRSGMLKFRLKFSNLMIVSILFLLFVGCSTEPVETNFLLPVDFANVPENMVLADHPIEKIEIRISAQESIIALANKQNYNYPVDLYTDLEFDPAGDSDSIEPGVYFIPVEKNQIPVGPDIHIISVKPSYLSVRLEKKVKKTFGIVVPYIGEPAKGYIALEASTDPSSMELTGPSSVIDAISDLKTKPIDLNNATEGFKKTIPLDIDASSIITTKDPIIIVSVPVRQKLVSKIIEKIPVQIWNSSSMVTLEPNMITIKIKGPFETLSNREIMDQIYAFVDLKNLKPGIYARHAYINIPAGLMMTAAIPQVFTVKIE